MLLERIQVKNFRCFVDFELTLAGDSVTVVAPNAGGKTTLLTAIGSALTGSRAFGPQDFHDSDVPLEILATLKELDAADQATFADAVQFGGGGGPTLCVGIRAIWDQDADQIDVTWGFPNQAWARAGKDARDRVSLLWLSASRDAGRLLSFVGARSILEELLASIDLGQPLDAALAAIETATTDLVSAPAMGQLLASLDGELADLIPDVAAGAFNIDPAASTPRELLSQLTLALGHGGPQVPVERQSSGLAQLAIFVVALRLAGDAPSIVLVDEQELSLHPQAQRAVARAVRERSHQCIVATHSSSVLSGADVRSLVRLKREAADVEARRATGVTDAEAANLARYTTPETAEAFFSRTVVFVEGPSDYLAVREAARRSGVDLDARGVAIVSLQGAGLLAIYLKLLGPNGLDLKLLGLCDLDAEADWQTKLTAAGVPVADRATMNASGFYVCDTDLEDELVRALGDAEVQAILTQENEAANFAAFASDPARQGLSLSEQLVAFARKRKVRWSPRLAAGLTAATAPPPISDLLSRV